LIYRHQFGLSINNNSIYSSLFVLNVHHDRIKETKRTRPRKIASYYYLKLEEKGKKNTEGEAR
jgi:hypothetical protein